MFYVALSSVWQISTQGKHLKIIRQHCTSAWVCPIQRPSIAVNVLYFAKYYAVFFYIMQFVSLIFFILEAPLLTNSFPTSLIFLGSVNGVMSMGLCQQGLMSPFLVLHLKAQMTYLHH